MSINNIYKELQLIDEFHADFHPTVESESRKTIFLDDENSERLRGISLEARCNPAVFLGMQEIFGDLGEHQVFRQGFSDALNSLWSDGVEKTLDNYLLS